jgi:hypothetical protein
LDRSRCRRRADPTGALQRSNGARGLERVNAYLAHLDSREVRRRAHEACRVRGACQERAVAIAHRVATRQSTEHDLLRACKTLAAIRRMRLPTVQVNLAQQQVNVGL